MGKRNQKDDPSWVCTVIVVIFALLSTVSFVLSGVAMIYSTRSLDRFEQQTNSTTSLTVAVNGLVAGINTCIDVILQNTLATAKVYDQLLLAPNTTKQWFAGDLCRQQSDPRFFGSGRNSLFIASNTSVRLSSELYVSSLTIANNATLFTNGWRVFVRDLFILNGTVDDSGAFPQQTYNTPSLGVRIGPTVVPNTNNTPSNSPQFTPTSFFGGAYELFTAAGTPRGASCPVSSVQVLRTPFQRGGAYHLQADPMAAISMRDLSGRLYTPGAQGCGAYYIQNVNGVIVPLAASGGAPGGVIVIAAHRLQLGPNARIDARGGSGTIPVGVFTRQPLSLLGLFCASAETMMFQAPAGYGGGGIVSIVTATALSQSEIDRVVRVEHGRTQAMPVFEAFCNSSSRVQSIDALTYRLAPEMDSDGAVFVHDVCDGGAWSRGQLDYDDDGFTQDDDNDCDDFNENVGNTERDVNNCGQCGNQCLSNERCLNGQCQNKPVSLQTSHRWIDNFFTSPISESGSEQQAFVVAESLYNGNGIRLLLELQVRSENLIGNASALYTITFDDINASPRVINSSAWIDPVLKYVCITNDLPIVVNQTTRSPSSSTFQVPLLFVNSTICYLEVVVWLRANVTIEPPDTLIQWFYAVVPYQIVENLTFFSTLRNNNPAARIQINITSWYNYLVSLFV